MADTSCPICGSAGSTSNKSVFELLFNCVRCGIFDLEFRFLAGLPTLRTDADFVQLLPYLSAHLRQSSESKTPVTVNHENWQTLAQGHAHTPVTRKLEMALGVYCQRSGSPGAEVQLSADDFVLMDAANVQEMQYLRDALAEQQLLSRQHQRTDPCVVTPKGWERLAPVFLGGVPGTCFVAMAFDPSLNDVYESAIAPAVKASGLTVIRVDKLEHNGIVTDVIQAEIRRAQVVVADVTLQRAGVYFEAGLALGLGRTVVWSCRQDEIEKVHFDTRQYNHVVWEDAPALRRKLEARLSATIPVTR